MSKLTKAEFIRQAEQELGYPRYKDLLKVLGYGERNLDRYKYDDEIIPQFVERFNDWKRKIQPAHEAIAPESEKPKDEAPDNDAGETEVKEWSGVGETVSNNCYHSSDNLSSSRLKMLLENPVQFYDVYVSKEHQKRHTEALLVGRLHHTLVLEPEQYDKDYIVTAGGLKADIVAAIKKLGGEVAEEANNKGELVVKETVSELNAKLDDMRAKEPRSIVTSKQVDIATSTSTKALDSWYVIEARGKELLRAQLRDLLELDISHIERTFYGEIDGVKFQVRPDLLMNLGSKEAIWFCVDLKTAEDATIDTFTKSASRFYYDLQEWLYREILRQNGIDVVDFRFCVAGKNESSKCSYFQMDAEDIEDAEKVARNAIRKYKFCKEHNEWKDGRFDYQKMRFEPVSNVKLPAWRKHQLIDMGVI